MLTQFDPLENTLSDHETHFKQVLADYERGTLLEDPQDILERVSFNDLPENLTVAQYLHAGLEGELTAPQRRLFYALHTIAHLRMQKQIDAGERKCYESE